MPKNYMQAVHKQIKKTIYFFLLLCWPMQHDAQKDKQNEIGVAHMINTFHMIFSTLVEIFSKLCIQKHFLLTVIYSML